MNKNTATIILLIGYILGYLVINWWIRMRFIVDGYKLGGSFTKRNNSYKRKWNWLQRLALIPLIGSDSNNKFHNIAYLNYIHFIATVYTLGGHILKEYYGINAINWINGTIAIYIVTVLEIIYMWIG